MYIDAYAGYTSKNQAEIFDDIVIRKNSCKLTMSMKDKLSQLNKYICPGILAFSNDKYSEYERDDRDHHSESEYRHEKEEKEPTSVKQEGTADYGAGEGAELPGIEEDIDNKMGDLSNKNGPPYEYRCPENKSHKGIISDEKLDPPPTCPKDGKEMILKK
jgi:hypothetical protein